MDVQGKMTVEIWSDVMCPFCYIGKRKFEAALSQFQYKDKIKVIWKSFQLNPHLKTAPGKNLNQLLAEHKGVSLEQAKAMNAQVTQLAAQVGLDYRLDKAAVANSFKAHRFAHFAKQQNLQNEAEEQLFKAYFTEGRNIDDDATLSALGEEIGLDTDKLKAALESGSFADEVRTDLYEAQQIDVRGVPFFLFNGKYTVSGAQEVTTFSSALEKSFTEWQQNSGEKISKIAEGQSCEPNGDC